MIMDEGVSPHVPGSSKMFCVEMTNPILWVLKKNATCNIKIFDWFQSLLKVKPDLNC